MFITRCKEVRVWRKESGAECDMRIRRMQYLVGGHAGDVVIERRHGLSTLGGVVSEELGEFGTVGRVLVDAELLERGGEERGVGG